MITESILLLVMVSLVWIRNNNKIRLNERIITDNVMSAQS